MASRPPGHLASQRPARGSQQELQERVRAAWGPAAWTALVSSGWNETFRLDGDERVFWVARVEPLTASFVPESVYPQYFDGRSFRDAPLGPERLARIMGSLALDVGDEAVRESVLTACNILVGTVIRTPGQASLLTDFELDLRAASRAADDAVVTLFEPPHLEGRTFVFCANVEHDPKSRGPAFLRLAVDGDSLGISTTYLCRGRGPAR